MTAQKAYTLAWVNSRCLSEFRFNMKPGFYEALENHPNFLVPCASEQEVLEKMRVLVDEWKEESTFFLIYWYPFDSHSEGSDRIPPGFQFQGFGANCEEALEAKKQMENINYSPAFVVKLPNGEQPDLSNIELLLAQNKV